MTMPVVRSAQSAEIRLSLLLCRYPILDGERAELQDQVSNVCSQAIDWPKFLQLVYHHRIVSLVLTNAQRLAAALPASVYEQLRSRSSDNAIESFRYLAEVQRLLALLKRGGIQATVIKGVALSIQAYGDVSTRDVGDIDLLIAPEHAHRADTLLLEGDQEGRSFQRSEPIGKLTSRRHAAYITSFKDFTYQPALRTGGKERSGFEVDLHWRLFRNPYMPGNSLAEEPRASVSAGSIKLESFSQQVNVLYLSVHGALDGWSRLKAVADVAALWKASSLAEQKLTIALAVKMEVLPYFQGALLLASEWIGGFPYPDITMSAEQTKLSAAITAKARTAMEENGFLSPLREASSWKMKQYEASLSRSKAYRLAILRRIWYRPRVWSRFNLPDRLFHLYPLLSPIEWLLFRWDRFFGNREEAL